MRIGAVSALLLLASMPAEAANPKVQGTYATISWHMCQTVIAATKSTVSKVNAPITVQGVTGLTTSTNTFVSALNPNTETFDKNGGTSSGQAITQLNPVTNSAISDVGAASLVDFVTVVNHADTQALTGIGANLNAGTAGGKSNIMSMAIGTVTFPANAASSGTAMSSNIEVMGHTSRLPGDTNSPGNAMARNVNKQGNTSFSLTTTTATIGGVVWDISVGNIVDGVANTINMLRRPVTSSPYEYCIDSMTLTKQ
jgi:hypothetical protein